MESRGAPWLHILGKAVLRVEASVLVTGCGTFVNEQRPAGCPSRVLNQALLRYAQPRLVALSWLHPPKAWLACLSLPTSTSTKLLRRGQRAHP